METYIPDFRYWDKVEEIQNALSLAEEISITNLAHKSDDFQETLAHWKEESEARLIAKDLLMRLKHSLFPT